MSESTRIAEQIREVEAQAARLTQLYRATLRAEEEASRPAEPHVPYGGSVTVLFTRQMSGRVYHYAAVGWRMKGGRPSESTPRWVVTGAETRRFNWRGLLAFIGELNWPSLALVVSARELVAPADVPAAAEVMGDYGTVRRTERVVDELLGVEHGDSSTGVREQRLAAQPGDYGPS